MPKRPEDECLPYTRNWYPTSGLLKERNAEVGQLTGEKAALEREIERLKEEVGGA